MQSKVIFLIALTFTALNLFGCSSEASPYPGPASPAASPAPAYPPPQQPAPPPRTVAPGATTFFDRAAQAHRAGNLDQALADYAKAIELDPKYADAYYNRAIVHEDKGDPDRAISDYSKTI